MSARAMHYGQSRRSPRIVANGTRGPHRGQGRREMKRGVNSLRQALRPPTSPIHTHSRVSCHCPIDGSRCYPGATRRDFAAVLSYLAGWISAKEGICKAMELPRTTTEEGDIGYRGQRAQGRGEPGYLRLGHLNIALHG